MIAEELPKIGIGVELELTGWGLIYQRTWDHPGPYPIPTYAEGGHDGVFIGWIWGFDWDPTGRFESSAWIPNGDNVYQYNSSDYDVALENYLTNFLDEDREEYAKEIQAILYEDLPSITILYPTSLYPVSKGFSGWDGLLWVTEYQSMEHWDIESKTELHYASPTDFEVFHPLLLSEPDYDAQWLHQVYNGLIIRENGTRTWTNRLTSSFNSANSGLTWTVTLDPNAKWADGQPVTPEDVIFTYQSILTPQVGSLSYSFYKQYFDNSSFVKLDNYTIQFQFTEAYAFPQSLLNQMIIPKHIWEAVPYENWGEQAANWATNSPNKIIGAGPYKLHSWNVTNGIIHLKENPYFKDLELWSEPILKDIFFEVYSNKESVLSALETGIIDILDAEFRPMFSELEEFNNIRTELVPYPGHHELALNNLHPYFGTGELCPNAGVESANHIRKALNHMIPRLIIIEETLEGVGSLGVTPFPEASFGFDESLDFYEYNISKAKDHMRAAGFEYSEGTSSVVEIGIAFPAIMGILALTGGCQLIIRLRKK